MSRNLGYVQTVTLFDKKKHKCQIVRILDLCLHDDDGFIDIIKDHRENSKPIRFPITRPGGYVYYRGIKYQTLEDYQKLRVIVEKDKVEYMLKRM